MLLGLMCDVHKNESSSSEKKLCPYQHHKPFKLCIQLVGIKLCSAWKTVPEGGKL